MHASRSIVIATAVACIAAFHGTASLAQDSTAASVAASGTIVDGSAALARASGAFVVAGITTAADASVVVLRDVATGAAFSVQVAGDVTQAASLAAGQTVRVVAEAAGASLFAGARMIAFVPSERARRLLYTARSTQM